jgi:tetratricopeptide (TPR) repeat protein
MSRFSILAVSMVVFALSAAVPADAAPKAKRSSTLPVTTSSAKARELYEKAVVDYENVQTERAVENWRAAVKEDPKFALAWINIAFNSRDPQEQKSALAQANALAGQVTPGERLFIKWLGSVRENDYVTGIAAMNDLVAQYPKDKRLLMRAASWLFAQQSYEPTKHMLERALAVDKNYPPALNDLGYVHAYLGEFPSAFEAMARYVKLLPGQPNPEDSFAEILRLSGDFKGALEHYRAALKIDPTFVSSQLGIADTYALMGDQPRAREEYQKAIPQAQNEADRLDYMRQQAITWVRENKLDEADRAFTETAKTAHDKGFDLQEARTLREQSLYQADDSSALKHLEQAESALGHNPHLAQTDREEERARILRCRVTRATHAGNEKLAAKTLAELEKMASSSRSKVIQQSFHAALGARLVAAGKCSDAIPHLQEDNDDPYSLELLSRCLNENGDMDELHIVETKLRSLNTPTIEQALVVIPARARPPVH